MMKAGIFYLSALLSVSLFGMEKPISGVLKSEQQLNGLKNKAKRIIVQEAIPISGRERLYNAVLESYMIQDESIRVVCPRVCNHPISESIPGKYKNMLLKFAWHNLHYVMRDDYDLYFCPEKIYDKWSYGLEYATEDAAIANYKQDLDKCQ